MHAISLATSRFAVLLADDLVLSDRPCLGQLLDVYAETGGNVVAVLDVPREETRHYGILDIENDDGRLASVKGLVEKPEPDRAPSTLSIIGRYVLQPEVFDPLEERREGADGEIQLTGRHGVAARAAAIPRSALRGPTLRLR